MDSPESDKCQSRFSTPVSELDDHRNQASSIPLADVASSPRSVMARRDTAQSISSPARPELLQVHEGFLEPNPVRRDFEQIVIDEDKGANEQHSKERRGSTSPSFFKRATSRRSQAPANRSRDSSPSSRSTSPANSVDAFADPRRRERTNTVGSKGPSNLDVVSQRTVSGGSHRRRPTFSNGSLRQADVHNDGASCHDPAENDVCFPDAEDSSKTYKIDFDELDEYVAESKRDTVGPGAGNRKKLSFSSQGNKPKRSFPSSSLGGKADVPKIVTHVATTSRPASECAIDDSLSVLDEKLDDPLGANGPAECQHSVAEPHRFSFFSSEIEETIHAAEFADLLSPGMTSRDLFNLPVDSGVWWMNVLNPTEEELNVFKGAFGIHRLTTEDIITQEAREKVELFNQYYFVCFRSFSQDKSSDDYMEPINLYMIVFAQSILTFTYSQSPHAANVRKRIGKLRDYMLLGADWICYAMMYVPCVIATLVFYYLFLSFLLSFHLPIPNVLIIFAYHSDDIVDTFIPVIDSIQAETDSIEEQVFIIRPEDSTPLLKLIGASRKKVMSLMRLLGGKADVIKGFAKRCTQSYTVTPRPEIGLYLGDIQDHVVTNMNNLGHFEKMLSRSHSNCLAQISMDAITQGNRTNKVLSKITLLATILVPLNLVCGLFGMNVPVPGGVQDGGLGWFFGILGGISFMVLCSLSAARFYRIV